MLKATELVIERARMRSQMYPSTKPKVLTTTFYKDHCLYLTHELY